MNKELKTISVITAALAVAVGLGAEVASAESGSPGAWPAAFPLPTAPGTVISQTSTTAAVRSTDQVAIVLSKLDNLYVTQKGCTLRLAVNRPKDYLCYDPATRKTDEIYFTFAALDPRPTDPSRSQTNAFSISG